MQKPTKPIKPKRISKRVFILYVDWDSEGHKVSFNEGSLDVTITTKIPDTYTNLKYCGYRSNWGNPYFEFEYEVDNPKYQLQLEKYEHKIKEYQAKLNEYLVWQTKQLLLQQEQEKKLYLTLKEKYGDSQ